jgi:hypothetical protein
MLETARTQGALPHCPESDVFEPLGPHLGLRGRLPIGKPIPHSKQASASVGPGTRAKRAMNQAL